MEPPSPAPDDAAAAPHPDDRPAPASRRALPAGVWWAVALAVVVLTVAGWQAMSSGGSPPTDPRAGAPVVRLGGPNGGSGLPPTLPDASAAADVIGKPTPAVTFTRFDGTTGDLSAYRGRPLVLNFWASWCVPCIEEMPAFEQVHQRLGDEVAFLGLNVGDTVDAGQAFAARTGVTYDLARDPDGSILLELGGVSLPTTVLVDRDGRIVDVRRDKLSADQLETIVNERLLP